MDMLQANKNKDNKNTKPNVVEVTTTNLKDSNCKFKNPLTVIQNGNSGNGLGYVVLG